MGFGGIGAWQLLILLFIVALVFGTKRLRNVGGDLGSALRGFRQGLSDDAPSGDARSASQPARLRQDAGLAADGESTETSSAAS